MQHSYSMHHRDHPTAVRSYVKRPLTSYFRGQGLLSGQSAGLMIERSQVRIPAGVAGDFSSPGSTFCADAYFGIQSTPALLQQHVKDHSHSVKSAGGRLQLNTHFTNVALHEVTQSMVVWCTQNLRRDGSSFMWHQPCQHCKYTTLVDIQKTRC